MNFNKNILKKTILIILMLQNLIWNGLIIYNVISPLLSLLLQNIYIAYPIIYLIDFVILLTMLKFLLLSLPLSKYYMLKFFIPRASNISYGYVRNTLILMWATGTAEVGTLDLTYSSLDLSFQALGYLICWFHSAIAYFIWMWVITDPFGSLLVTLQCDATRLFYFIFYNRYFKKCLEVHLVLILNLF